MLLVDNKDSVSVNANCLRLVLLIGTTKTKEELRTKFGKEWG